MQAVVPPLLFEIASFPPFGNGVIPNDITILKVIPL